MCQEVFIRENDMSKKKNFKSSEIEVLLSEVHKVKSIIFNSLSIRIKGIKSTFTKAQPVVI